MNNCVNLPPRQVCLARVERAVCRGLTLFCCYVLRFVALSFESKAYSCTRRRFVGCIPNEVDTSCKRAAQRLRIAVCPCIEQCVRACFDYKSKQRVCNALCSVMVPQMTVEDSLARLVAWTPLWPRCAHTERTSLCCVELVPRSMTFCSVRDRWPYETRDSFHCVSCVPVIVNFETDQLAVAMVRALFVDL